MNPSTPPPSRIKGRGSASNPEGRFESTVVETYDDGWYRDDGEAAAPPATTVTEETARTIISRNDSPDIPFDQSLNPFILKQAIEKKLQTIFKLVKVTSNVRQRI